MSVYLLSDLSEKEEKTLAGLVNGQIVSDISGCINFVQIKVKESSLEELNRIADTLNQSEGVLYASYDAPMFIQLSAADNNPWSDNTSTPEIDRGNEDNPDGNDWWAEAIGAYTAWEYVDSHSDELKPVKVGVIDDGFFTEHEDLRGKIEILNGGNVTNDEKSNPGAHGTAVSGIIAANNNDKGIRGVADHVSLLCADWSFFDEDGNSISLLSTGQYIELTKQMVEKECKVINCSFAVILPSQESFDKNNADMDMYPILSALSVNRSFYNYENILALYQREAKLHAMQCTILMTELLMNGKDQFLIVQSAGNGYDGNLSLPGYDARYSGFYCGITEDLFNEIFLSKDKNDVLKTKGVTYRAIDEHLLIVGGIEKSIDGNESYSLLPGSGFGRQVDICAPGEKLFVCGTVENGNSKYNDDWNGTSFSSPMVSGAAALLWSIDPSLSAADVRQLLLESGTSAVGVGEDAGTDYPMLNIGASVKKLTGWSNVNDIQEGLYIVPNTQNILYVEQDEDEISFTAWWFKLASVEETAILKGSDAEFVCGEEGTGKTSGKLHFDTAKVILTLDENRFPFLDERTEYSWLRESMWELSEEQLQEIGQALRVPANLNIEYIQDEAYYWEAGGRYVTYVQIFYNNEVIATATVDSFTGELIRDMTTYSESTTETASVTMNIPNGAKEFNGHYYYVYEGNDYSDWNAAQEYCVTQGGHLATITSQVRICV